MAYRTRLENEQTKSHVGSNPTLSSMIKKNTILDKALVVIVLLIYVCVASVAIYFIVQGMQSPKLADNSHELVQIKIEGVVGEKYYKFVDNGHECYTVVKNGDVVGFSCETH